MTTKQQQQQQQQSFKLKNPTEYHLLATQQQQQQQQQQGYTTTTTGISLGHLQLNNNSNDHLDFSDCFSPTIPQQQFLSPISPPLQDFDDEEEVYSSTATSAARIGNMMISPQDNDNYFFPSTSMEESPSDDYSSVDFFSHPQPSSYLLNFHANQPVTTMENSILYNKAMTTTGAYPFSAPAHMGYHNPLLSTSSSSIHNNLAAAALYQHHHHQPPPPTTLVHSNSTNNVVGPRSFEEYESIQMNQQLLSEKKRRRRESHNAVERRRRENINERIQELGTMLPESMLEELMSTSTNTNGGGVTNNNNKPNKGAILRKSVDHIKLLQQEVSSHKQRIFELERQLAALTTASAN